MPWNVKIVFIAFSVVTLVQFRVLLQHLYKLDKIVCCVSQVLPILILFIYICDCVCKEMEKILLIVIVILFCL